MSIVCDVGKSQRMLVIEEISWCDISMCECGCGSLFIEFKDDGKQVVAQLEDVMELAHIAIKRSSKVVNIETT